MPSARFRAPRLNIRAGDRDGSRLDLALVERAEDAVAVLLAVDVVLRRLAENHLDLFLVQLFFLHQGVDELIEFAAMFAQNGEGAVVGLAEQLLYFLVDNGCRRLAEVAWLLNLLAQKHVLLADAERHGTELIAHAPVR